MSRLTKRIFNWDRTRGIRYLIKDLAIIFVLSLFGVFGCGYLFLLSFSSGLCATEIFQEIYSPDKKYRVVVFQRDCGATTGFSTQISILKASEELPNKNGNIFRMDDHPDYTNVRVGWDSDRAISIDYSPVDEVFKKKDKYRDASTMITIDYEVIEK